MLRAILFLLFLSPTAALALSGLEYLERCERFPSVEERDAGMCLYYVSGVIDGARTGAQAARLATSLEAAKTGGFVAIIGDVERDLGVCLERGVSIIQTTAMFVKHLQENPNEWHLPAAETLMGLLRKSFPCP